ncbi:MAG: DUF4381 domain-containing protein [Candidatus Thiodiazotropha sp.]|jgi:hypothetical protein
MNPTSVPPTLPATPNPLAELRGYHLPDPVSWWPPAPGWWILAALLLIMMGLLAGWFFRRQQRRASAHQAIRELDQLCSAQLEKPNSLLFIRRLSSLLRRFALTRFPRHEVAGLAGSEWLEFLDTHGGAGQFREGSGQLLSDAPYLPNAEVPVEELATLVRNWIQNNQEQKP